MIAVEGTALLAEIGGRRVGQGRFDRRPTRIGRKMLDALRAKPWISLQIRVVGRCRSGLSHPTLQSASCVHVAVDDVFCVARPVA